MEPSVTVTNEKAWIGIDVSKDTLDVCVLPEHSKPHHQVFPNTPGGFSALLRFAERTAPEAARHFCLESTGSYSTGIAAFLTDSNERVSVVNPFRVKHAGMAQGVSNKTDHADARLLADFCRKEQPAPWRMAAPEVRALIGLMRRLKGLQDHLQQEENRLQEPGLLKEVQRSIQHTIRFLNKEIQRLRKQIDRHIDENPSLKEDRDLLMSIPGIGEITALWILAELPDVEQFESAQSAAAYAGLNPREHKSGTSVRKRTRLSKRGNSHLRRALYMPALTAKRCNPVCQRLYNRLIDRGLSGMAALGAVMRKLLMIAYSVLRHRTPFFDPADSVA